MASWRDTPLATAALAREGDPKRVPLSDSSLAVALLARRAGATPGSYAAETAPAPAAPTLSNELSSLESQSRGPFVASPASVETEASARNCAMIEPLDANAGPKLFAPQNL